MESAELNYAVQLSVELEQIKQKKHMAETNLSANDEISMLNQELMEAAHSQQVKVWDKLRLIHSCWLNRFRQHPEWFIQHYYRIRTLPAPILEIKMEIEKYMNGQKYSISSAHRLISIGLDLFVHPYDPFQSNLCCSGSTKK